MAVHDDMLVMHCICVDVVLLSLPDRERATAKLQLVHHAILISGDQDLLERHKASLHMLLHSLQ